RGESTLRLRHVADREERRAVRKASRAAARASTLEIAPHEEVLWNALRDLRSRLAREQNVPAYVVFHDATLLQMLRERPRTRDELGAISGVGANKLARYGDAFLQLMRAD